MLRSCSLANDTRKVRAQVCLRGLHLIVVVKLKDNKAISKFVTSSQQFAASKDGRVKNWHVLCLDAIIISDGIDLPVLFPSGGPD